MDSQTLTRKEIDLIRKSWMPVAKDMTPIGKLLFSVLFGMYPQYQELFERFREEGKPLIESEQFIKHAVDNVMESLNKIVNTLDKDEERKTILSGIGSRHSKRNVKGVHFQNISGIIMETLKQGMGEAFTDDVSKAWQKMLTINLSMIGEACDKAACS